MGVLLVAVLAFFGVTEPTNTDIPPFPPPEDGAATILLPAGAIQASQPLTITGVLTGVQLLYVGPAQPH